MATTTVSGNGFGYVSKLKTATGPDPKVVADQLEWLQSTLQVLGQEDFCSRFFWILLKREVGVDHIPIPESFWNRRLVPFYLNDVQRDMVNHEKKRNICLKYRQGGYTTDKIIRRLYLPAITEPGAGCLLISQNHFYAAQHFAILKRTHRYFGTANPYNYEKLAFTRWFHANLLHTTMSNRRELVFDQLDSKILVDSAEQEEVGQGLTLNHVVATELARWPGKPEETLANVKESMPDDGTLDYESTANGFGGYFYEECLRSRDPQNVNPEFHYFFHEWWWHKEYRAKYVPAEHLYRMSDVDVNFHTEPLTDKEKELRASFHLKLGQIAFRRIKKDSLRHNFDEKYPEDDMTCFLVSGANFFDRDILRFRLVELQNYVPLIERRNGEVRIFKRRIKGKKYVIGADTATGRQVGSEHTDFSAAVVIDEETGEEMASLRGKMPPEDFADDLVELALTYNGAMIAVERGTGGDGGVVLYRLEEMRYWNIYKHRDKFRARAVGTVKKVDTEVPGLPMTPKTRPICLNRLRAFVEDYPGLIYDKTFIEECFAFARKSKDGKPVGGGDEENAHDDTIMARGIAYAVRLVQLGFLDFQMVKSEKYGQEEVDGEAEGEAAT